MQSSSNSAVNTIVYREKSFSAATCRSCGAKMYPKSLLKRHVNRHQRRHIWYLKELGKLQATFAHMRDIA